MINKQTTMKTYTDYMINNTSASSQEKKEELRNMVYALTGWFPPKSLSMKAINNAVGL